MSLTQQQCNRFWEKGWLVVEDVFDSKQADNVSALAMSIVDKEYIGMKPGYLVDHNENGKLLPRKLDGTFPRDRRFRQFILSPKLLQLVESLLGHSPLLMSDVILFKPPRHGTAKPYHQDNFYFRLSPADEVVTSWIALDDVDLENGCMRYIDGSHRGAILPHYPIPGEEEYNSAPRQEAIDLSKESAALVRKGGVVFHHCQTLHTSHRNTSNRWRKAYIANWVTPNVTCETETLETAYFRREDYPKLIARG
jgi:phytanoyl-CoA hydroxylase